MEKFATIDGVEYFNMGTMNFLGFVGNARIEVSFSSRGCLIYAFKFFEGSGKKDDLQVRRRFLRPA